jgi:hypothetical protein
VAIGRAYVWNGEQALIKRSQISSRNVGDEELKKVVRFATVKRFISEGSNLKNDALSYLEPMTFFKSRSNVMVSLDRWKNNARKRILNSLKFVKGGCLEAVI